MNQQTEPVDCLVKHPGVEKYYKSLSYEERLQKNMEERQSILKLLTNNLKEHVKLTTLNEKS